jgi:hypothetical protein
VPTFKKINKRVPFFWVTATQPAGTVCIQVVNPPLQFARKGFSRAMLKAAGYEEVAVVHEQLGNSRLMGDADMRTPCADCIVAYVQAPDEELILRQQPQLWEREQEQRLDARQCGRQLQQERILHAQQKETRIDPGAAAGSLGSTAEAASPATATTAATADAAAGLIFFLARLR